MQSRTLAMARKTPLRSRALSAGSARKPQGNLNQQRIQKNCNFQHYL